MPLTPEQRSLIERVINAFETGSADGDYGAIVIFHDGPHNIRQITYGRSQTTEFGNLRELVADYVNANGIFSSALARFADRVGREPLTDNDQFKDLLRRAGREDPIMRRVQDLFFERRYFKPAMKWAGDHGFSTPLAALVIYDSFIHSGSILNVIRNRFPETPPSAGGREKVWIAQYVKARHSFLENHERPIVRKTIYRTRCLQREIDRNNWDLETFPIDANGVAVSPAATRSRGARAAAVPVRARKAAKQRRG